MELQDFSFPHSGQYQYSTLQKIRSQDAAIFDREQRSKVLKEALLLLFLILARNQVPKMFEIEQKLCKGTKNVQENKKCARKQKMCKGTKNVPISQNEVHKRPMRAKCYLLWHIMVLNFRVCLVLALCGLVWPCCFSRQWQCVASFDLAWPCISQWCLFMV